MKNKLLVPGRRSMLLIVLASLLMMFGLVLIWVGIANISSFGWLSLLFALSGLTTVGAAIASLVRNSPAWILLDLIIPG